MDNPGIVDADGGTERGVYPRAFTFYWYPAQPETVLGYYRDITVQAFPTPAAERVRMAELSPKLTYGRERTSFDAAKLMDGNPGTVVVLPPEAGHPQYLNIAFSQNFTARSLTVALGDVRMLEVTWPWSPRIDGTLEVSDDGQRFRTVCPLTLRWPVSALNFPKVTARFYRLVLRPEGTAFAHGIPLGEVELNQCLRIADVPGKAAYIRQGQYSDRRDEFMDESVPSGEMVVERNRIVDLSANMDRAGRGHDDAAAAGES